MVAGQQIDPDEVSEFAGRADLVVAHNASFDRRFLERFCPPFCAKPWACSMAEIDWAAEGFEGTKLAYLAAGFGFFFDRHRAANDCLAAVELLSQTLPRSGVGDRACVRGGFRNRKLADRAKARRLASPRWRGLVADRLRRGGRPRARQEKGDAR
jgi:DNA polymerase III epsilon subunit-like protein